MVLNPTKGLGRKEPNMIIIGADYHPGFQQIAFVDTDAGNFRERRIGAPRGGGEVLSRSRVAKEMRRRIAGGRSETATKQTHWFERSRELQCLNVDWGCIRQFARRRVTEGEDGNTQDAQFIVKLMLKDEFPVYINLAGESGSVGTAMAPSPRRPPTDADYQTSFKRWR